MQEILEQSELGITEEHLIIHSKTSESWLTTIDAIYEICKKKQYKGQYKNVIRYIKDRYPGINKEIFYNLKEAGKICRELKQSHTVLPGNSSLWIIMHQRILQDKRSMRFKLWYSESMASKLVSL